MHWYSVWLYEKSLIKKVLRLYRTLIVCTLNKNSMKSITTCTHSELQHNEVWETVGLSSLNYRQRNRTDSHLNNAFLSGSGVASIESWGTYLYIHVLRDHFLWNRLSLQSVNMDTWIRVLQLSMLATQLLTV